MTGVHGLYCAGPPILVSAFLWPKHVGVIDVMVVFSQIDREDLETYAGPPILYAAFGWTGSPIKPPDRFIKNLWTRTQPHSELRQSCHGEKMAGPAHQLGPELAKVS